MISLRSTLADFDGKETSRLEAIRSGPAPEATDLDEAIALLSDSSAELQIGASWLLRAWLEDGAELDEPQTDALADRLTDVLDGFPRLHLCQLARHLRIPGTRAADFAAFYSGCLESPNTFVRAWAPDAFFRLAAQHESWNDEARRHVEAALTDEKASVRARARRLIFEG